MKDRHLNIFYSYNHNLIEKNMTRAFIVTLKTVSSSIKNKFIKQLLKYDTNFNYENDYNNIDFALQSNIPLDLKKIPKIKNKFLISITGKRYIDDLEDYKDIKKFNKIKVTTAGIPDAWFYENNKKPEYCFLIECKYVLDNLFADQIIYYAKQFYKYDSFNDIEKNLFYLTWYDIIEVCESLFENKISDTEKNIISDLIKYLGFHNVVLFRGIDLNTIPEFPNYKFISQYNFDFNTIPELPNYKFKTEIFNFGFDNIPPNPRYNLIIEQGENNE